VIAVLVAAVAAAILAALAQQQIGGQTGDVLGATEQVCEVAVLLTLAARVVQA
jgi:adenosylcobinamide-GDP ribazoletransferase